jgi:RecJ-like exonuclease
LGSSKDFLLDLSKTACAADKSNVFEIDQKSVDKALVLDFLCAHASFGNKLEFYKSVLSKSDLFDSLLIRAKDEIIASSNKAKRTIKETIIQKTRFFVFSLEDSVTKGEWPPSSKVTTFIFEQLVKEFPNDPIVCIGTNPKTIILRINDLAINEGFETNVIVEKLKSSMPDFIESGGGHPKAGAIRVKEGFVKDVLNQILRSFD